MKTYVDSSVRRKILRSACLAVLLGGLASPALAAETATQVGSGMEFELAPVTVEAKRPDWETKLSPGTVTVIRPDEYKGEQKTLPDYLKEVPGVHVREVNGKGQYTTVTVRGSTAAQVGVFVDGVLTNLGGDSAVDISTIPVKNVERIEVYRGYIPARFGGTFIGGVINIVTKKPTKIGASAEVGKTSLGGKSLSAEMTAPLGGGSLLIGANYESSDGDFEYKNYAAHRGEQLWQSQVLSYENATDLAKYNAERIDNLVNANRVNLTPEQIEKFKSDPEAWKAYYSNTDSNDPSQSLRANMVNTAEKGVMDKIENPGAWNDNSGQMQNATGREDLAPIINEIQQDPQLWGYYDKLLDTSVYRRNYAGFLSREDLQHPERRADPIKHMIYDDWTNQGKMAERGGYFTEGTNRNRNAGTYEPGKKDEMLQDYKAEKLDPEANAQTDRVMESTQLDPDKNPMQASYKEELEKARKKLKYAEEKRHRRYNDYHNTNFLAKWQDDNWMAKFSWNKIERHMPDSLWGDDYAPIQNSLVDVVDDIYYADDRKQKIDTTEALVENRHHNGRLEYGIRFDYQHQNKEYRVGKKNFYDLFPKPTYWAYGVLREWSRYRSNKYNIQLDGSYKLSDRQMLDFQTNISSEKLHVYGSNMDKVLQGEMLDLATMRNRYKQDIFNLQLQDSITLDKKGTWILTPAVRYNRSKITGYSDGKRFAEVTRRKFGWLHPEDSQTDDKWTWQLALQKTVNDHLTLRTTGGTYYRLLNMYEIAGDGAGILPNVAVNKDGTLTGSLFPQPEEGKQFDFSVLLNGKVLGADNTTTITYFWRDSKRMLQLWRRGYDYWSYFNDNKAKGHGFEFESNFKWSKFDLDIKATETLMSLKRKNATVGYGYYSIYPTYQPEWESNVRLTYHPNTKWSFFGEMHYTDSYYTYGPKDERGPKYSFPTTSIHVYNGGVKWQPKKNLQITVGCNDIFNEGPKQKVWLRENTGTYPDGYAPLEYPIQGRTYYATLRYVF